MTGATNPSVGNASRPIFAVRSLTVLLCLTALAVYAHFSWRWTIVWDTSVMHYVQYLMHHGLRPYRDISDSNLPGTYLTDHWAMVVFGNGDTAWRLYDFFLSGLVILSFIVVAAPYDWVAGLLGGALFCLAHGSEGPNSAVEREQIMTALLAVALAASFVSFRRRLPVLHILFGLAAGLAASVKPTCLPLVLVVLGLGAWNARRRGRPFLPAIFWGCAGALLAALAVAIFFLQTHSFLDFIHITRTLLPAYVASRSVSPGELLRLLLPRNVLIPLVLAVPLFFFARRGKEDRWSLEHWAILAALLFGAVSFFAQRKGFVYQRYPFLAFLFLLLAMQFFGSLESSWSALPGKRLRLLEILLASLGLASLLLVSLPHYLLEMRRAVPLSAMPFTTALQSDLEQLGPTNLQRNIECFDLTDGCFSALYHLDILQSNGYTGDLLFFSPTSGPTVDFYRAQYWQLTAVHPPAVLVLSNNWFQAGHTFSKVDAWPAFAEDLRRNYVPVRTRYLTLPGTNYAPNEPPGYRLYVRRDSPLLSRAQRLFHPQPAALSPSPATLNPSPAALSPPARPHSTPVRHFVICVNLPSPANQSLQTWKPSL